jgi:hypothetical protein
MYSRELCTSKASVRMMPSRHLLPDLSVTISYSSGDRLLSVSLTTQNPLSLVGWWSTVSKCVGQGRKLKRLRLGYLDRMEVAEATRGPERPPWEPKTPRQD